MQGSSRGRALTLGVVQEYGRSSEEAGVRGLLLPVCSLLCRLGTKFPILSLPNLEGSNHIGLADYNFCAAEPTRPLPEGLEDELSLVRSILE